MIPPFLREGGDFRPFWAAQGISLVGDQVALIALPLVAILALDAGAAQMGYLTAAALVPNLLFSLHLGAWIDRRGRRRQAMVAADLGRAALVVSIPLAYALDALTIEQLYAVAFASGTLSVLFYVSYSTLFVSIVPRERYVEANQLLHGSRALANVGGPSLGGGLVQVLSAPAALVADALSFLASAFFLARIDPVEPPTEERATGHLAAGVRFIWTTAILRASLLALATINFFNFVFFALFVLYATRELDVRPGTLGLVLGAGAVGGVLGSVAVGRIVRRMGIGPALVLGCVVFPAPLVLVPLAAGPHPVVLAMLLAAEFGSGFGVMVLDVTAGSLQQAIVPDRLRARFAGAHMVVNYGVRPLGALAGGWLGSTIGVQETLWIATLGALAGVLFLLPSPLPRLRDLPREPAWEN
ncbi:MAG TPA: MFS transporter [Gaiellaceae bacterium]|nr:MFS transporter [Gaiellaceae bacterium]